jgi:hypothetical protein
MYKYKMYRASTMEGSGETCNSQVMNDWIRHISCNLTSQIHRRCVLSNRTSTTSSSLLWNGTHGWFAVSSRSLGTIYRSHLQTPSSRRGMYSSLTTLPLKIGPIYCTETLGTNYQSTRRNTPEVLRFHLNWDGRLKSRKF